MASTKGKKRNALINYFDESYQELKKVAWPTKNRAIRVTFLVLGFVVVVALFIGILDFAFGIGHHQLLELGPTRTAPATVDVTGGAVDGVPITIGEGGDAGTLTVETEPVVEEPVVDELPAEVPTEIPAEVPVETPTEPVEDTPTE